MKFVALLAAALLVSACAARKEAPLPLAHRPSGIVCELRMTLEYNRIIRHGELIEVSEHGLLLLVVSKTRDVKPRLIRFPLGTLRYGRCEAVGRIELTSRSAESDAAALQRLALLSRYPQGLSDPLLKNLLRAYGQPQLLVAGENVLRPAAR